MKLRNKKTGEIIDTLCSDDITKGLAFGVDHHNGSPTMAYYNSLAELNKDWEDYEEPKGTWTIDPMNEGYIDDGKYTAPDELERYEELGLKFDTKEEAEKVVEKLKAWKRLRDNGFRFNAWYGGSNNVGWEITNLKNGIYIPEQICDDLNLLFGGEK